MKENNREKILMILVVILGSLVRLLMAYFHFVHYDDIGIAVSYFWHNNDGLNFLWNDGWTYAPLQILFTIAFLSPQNSYALNVFLGRLPSALCGIFSIIGIYFLIRKFNEHRNMGRESRYLAVFASTLIAFSWQNIIYSAQAEPYSIGVFFITVILLFSVNDHEMTKHYQFVGLSFIMAVLCYGQYQMFVFVFAFYVAAFFECLYKRKYKLLLKYLLASVGSLFLTLPLLFKITNLGLLSRGTNWNVGPDNCYLFTYSNSGFGGLLKYSINFFLSNIYSLYANFFVTNKENLLTSILTIFFIALSLIGFISLQRKENYRLKVFIDVSLFINFVMIILGKLTLSPSRHTMVLIPFMVLFICEGVRWIFERGVNKRIQDRLVVVFIAIIMLIFLLDFPNEFNKRKMVLNEETIQQLVEEYEPDIICGHGYFFAINLMEFPGYENKGRDVPLAEYSYFVENQEDENLRIMFVGSGPISEDSIEKIREDIKNNFEIETLSYNSWKEIYRNEMSPKSATEYAKAWGEGGNGGEILIYDTN